jgi:hypothetical protein
LAAESDGGLGEISRAFADLSMRAAALTVTVAGNDEEVEFSGAGNIAIGWDSSATMADSTGLAGVDMDEGAGAAGAVATEFDAGRVSGFSRSIHWNTGITMANAIAAAIANQ